MQDVVTRVQATHPFEAFLAAFAVDPDSLNSREVQLTHVNLNDHTLEGFRHRTLPAFCVQYHPEAAPGPHDSHYLFDDFVNLMTEFQRGH